MTLEELEREWEVSSYEEYTSTQLDYYINLASCKVGDRAYLYGHEEDTLDEMTIVYIIWRSDNPEYYDGLLDDDVLIDGEVKYESDTSAEFITDDDCCLVWFQYL